MSSTKKRPRSPRRADLLTQALESFEQIEGRFYEGIRALKMARKQCGELLANANRHAHAMRALNTIAASPCEIGWGATGHKNCNAALAAGDLPENERCWPCYAKHVLDGGTP